MRARTLIGGLLCLLCAAGVWLIWHQEHGSGGSPSRSHAAVAPAMRPHLSSAVSRRGVLNTNPAQISQAVWNTNRFAGRLSNTAKPIGQLVNDSHAILLANALIDTAAPLNFVFPKNLQPQGDPGAYIVQARGPIDNAFRAMLAQAGATVVSYIPNDAYLVRASASVAGALEADPLTQAVVPYEPYYKIQSSLLYPAVGQLQMPNGVLLKLGLFADDAPATIQQIEKLGGQVFPSGSSPFGPVVNVIPPQNWTTLATLSGVQIVEPFHPRTVANDLSRAMVGVAADSLTATNYFNLTGSNILVEVNDTGIDAQHPDLTAGGNYGKVLGVIGDAPQSLVDTDGHGTHVAGIIAGDGTESTTVTNAPGSILNNGQGTNYQFRGMAPGATLYSVGGITGGGEAGSNFISDLYFQETPALTNALISNNSWVYEGDSAYDLAAASYDAATRDALPFATGSQPVLFVFAAGNAGDGSDSEDLGGGIADSIESPATAKDVITVGAVQEQRNITATVTNADGSSDQPWQAETATDYRVAGFSSRGNVGIGIEGTYGRYKPDVCAPGTFTLSTRSEQWDINSYFYQNPTNDQIQYFTGYSVNPGAKVVRPFPAVPSNAVQLTIETFPNANSPFSFAILPTLIGLFTAPGYQYISTNDPVLIPPDPNAPTIAQILASGQGFTGAFNFAISNNTPNQVIFDLFTDIETTNGTGNYFLVLSNLDQNIGTINGSSTGPGPYYRFESGTSMSAADVSGVLALMQEFYANAFGARPSPAMLKAMLINGAQATGLYTYQVQNTLNYEGWGMVNLPGSLPPGTTNQLNVACSAFIQDQSTTNALATGARQTYFVTTTNAQPLRVTLAWTDPPGDPAAAIKLVNNLVLVVTNLSNPASPIVYYGNDIGPSTINNVHGTNDAPVIDTIDNVQNVYLPPSAGTNFSVTVLGYRVNVNAVTAQTNNVVQDYALVISTGTGSATNVMTVSGTAAPSATPPPVVYNSTSDQQITYLNPAVQGSGANASAYQLLLNQFVGANSPLLGTNTVVFSTNAPEGFGPDNWQVTVGQTNQWQFYVVTNPNPSALSNAAFITFNPNAPDPDTLSVPRLGVFSSSVDNATREADIDMYVSTDPSITNLNPEAISNAVVGTQIGGPPGGAFAGASLGRGTTEFVVDTNSWSRPAPNVYYIGIKSEDQQSAEYGFISVFSAMPFSSPTANGQQVNGVPVPMNIPDGSPKIPGKAYIFGLALYPMEVGGVTVSNNITHQNFGDLIGTLTLNGGHADVLNNHDSFGSAPNTTPPNTYGLLYDDSAGGGQAGSRPSDGPGTLINYLGLQAIGAWMLTEVDDSLTQTGAVNSYTVNIQRYQNPTLGVISNSVPGGSWVFGFIDVPPGATNLTIFGTNLTDTANPPVELFVQYGAEPTTNSFIPPMVVLNPNGVFSLGPPLASGRYFFGLYNPNPNSPAQGINLFATISGPSAQQTIYTSGDTPIPIPDDAVTNDSIIVPDSQAVASLEVALRVAHPRVSDLVFHLIGPDGTRDLLVENRGADTADMGATLSSSNSMLQSQTFSGGATPPTTNIINPGTTTGTLQISYNFYTLPDELAVFYPGATTNFFDSGMVSGAGSFSIPYTNSPLVIVMNPNGNPGGSGDAWTYTLNALQTNAYSYLVLTEDTNRTTTPIKFAIPPLVGSAASTNVVAASSFDSATPGDYTTAFNDGTNAWNVLSNQVSVVNDPANADSGSNFLALANGTVSTLLPTVPGKTYVLSFRYRGPGIAAWWRGESNTVDSINGNIGTTNGGVGYANGEVGTAFQFDGTSGYISVPASPSLNIGAGSGVTIEGWINPNNPGAAAMPVVEWDATAGGPDGLQLWAPNPGGSQSLYANVKDSTGGNHQINSPNGLLNFGHFQHVALTYDTNSGVADLYINGNQVNTANFGSYTPQTTYPLYLGKRTFSANEHYGGLLDELSLYNRALSASEIKAIAADGTAGKFDPNVAIPQSLAEAQVSVGGGTPTTLLGNNTGWQTKTIIFTASQSGMPLQITGLEPGVLLDSFSLSQAAGDLYYLPEQSLDTFDGLDALGAWTLEIQDDRAGATNPPPQLLSWQLRFIYTTTSTNANGIPPGSPQTNIIQPGSWAYYPVNVPTNADYATNILVSATGLLDMWFNSATNPIGINPPDWPLLAGSIGGSSILSTFSVPTNIVPGATYYIGLHNASAAPVTYVFEVNFHYFTVTPLQPGMPIIGTVAGTLSGDGVNYYSVAVPSDVDYATNLLVSSTEPVNVWFNQTKPPVCTIPPDSLLIGNATNGAFTLSAGSAPPLVPGATYYLAVQDTNASNANFMLEVNFHIYTQLTNGVPTTNSVPPNSFAYYTVTVPTNADYATNLLLFATTNLNVWFNQYAPPIGVSPADSLLISNATSGTSILSATSAPPLVPGATYYLGVQNTNAVAVNFGLEVEFHLVLPVTITGPTITQTNINGTNGFLLQWSGPTNYQYTIQWKTNLTPVIPWNTVLNPVINVTDTPTNGDYSWFDDGSLTGGWPPQKFYRVVANLLSGPITNAAPVTNIVVSGTITPLTVAVPANAIAATNTLISATGPVNVWFNQNTQPTGNTGAGDVLMISTNTSGTFLLTGSSVPPLVPGTNYYLGVQSLGTSNVSFVFQVSFAFAPATNPPTISSITVTNVNGTNDILLRWTEPTNYQFQVEWATNLAPAIAWHIVPGVVVTWSGIVSPTNPADGLFQFLDDGSLTGGLGPVKFYRLIEYPYSTPIPQTLTIINTAIIGNAVQFQWVAPTNYQYSVLWTTNLGLPLASWSVLANPALGLSNGVYTFTDTNQTGPATSPKYFRLREQ